MAKNPIDDDVDLGDMDYDSSLDVDLNLGDDEKPKEGAREVAKAAVKSFGAEVKSQLTDSSYTRKLLGIMMPKGYSQAFNAYDGTVNAVKQIYGDNEGELRPLLAKSNRLLTRRGNRFKSILPKGLKDLLQSAEDAEAGSDPSRETSELDGNLTGLNDLFKFEINNKAERLIEDTRKELKEEKQYKLNLTHLQNISGGMSRLVAYQDQINIAYQRKNLEIGFRQYDIQRKLLITTTAFHKDAIERLDNVSKNTGLPDYVKLQTTEAIKGRLREKLADTAISKLDQFRQGYLKKIVEGGSGVIGMGAGMVNSMLGMMGQAGDTGQSKSEMAGMMIGSTIGAKAKESLAGVGEHVAGMLAPIIAKAPGVKDKGAELSIMFSDPIGYLTRWAQSDTTTTGMGSFLSGVIKPLIPQHVEKGRIESDGLAGLSDPAMFDNLFYTSVTKIMPKYMESMERSLRSLVSGNEEEAHAYSHYTQSMVTRDTLDAQNWRIGALKGQKDITKDEIERLLGKLGAESLSKEAKQTLGLRLVKDMRRNYNFDPTDYTQIDSWANTEEKIANELQDFFADKFDVDVEGKMSSEHTAFLSEVMEQFSDSSKRLPDVVAVIETLTKANVMDRDYLRRKGLSTFDGIGADDVNLEAINKILLGGDDLNAKAIEAEEVKSKTWKETFTGLSETVKARLEAEEDYRKELAIKAITEGVDDKIDVDYNSVRPSTSSNIRPIRSSNPLANSGPVNEEPTSGFEGTQSLQGLKGARAIFRVRDQGTYTRLDAIQEQLNNFTGKGGGSDKLADTIDRGMESIKAGSAKIKNLASTGKDKAKDMALDLKARTDKWYRESPKVKAVVDRVEKEYGKITDPNLRMELIEKVYKTTGTPEEIYSKLSSAGEYVNGKYVKAKNYLTDLYSRKDEWVEIASETYVDVKAKVTTAGTDAGRKVKEKAKDTSEMIKEMYESRDRYIEAGEERIKATMSRLKEGGHRTAEKSKTMVGKGVDFIKGLKPSFGSSDRGTHLRLDGTNRLLFTLLQRQGYEGTFESLMPVITAEDMASEKPKRGIFGKLLTSAKWSITTAMDATGLMARGTWGATRMGASAVGGVGSALLGDKTWGIRDIMIIGEKKPRLRAADIRNGKYVDKESKKVITKLKDINGPVIEISTGNEVISQEEIDQKLLVNGDGESLIGYLGRGAVKLGGKVALLSAAYLGGAYGVLGALGLGAAKLITKVIKDQMTQFDAYIPGDPVPRIRSKLMQQGFYRDEKGEPIMGLDKIKGPVYDPDRNLIISQEEITKYKSLYSQNGSILFTFGRGMVSATNWMARKAFSYYIGTTKALFKGSMMAVKGVGRGVMALGKRLLGIKKRRPAMGESGDAGDGLATDILLEQLRIQDSILKEMQSRTVKGRAAKKKEDAARAKEAAKPKNDADGDGVRDNSWLDILNRRKKRGARGPNADVVAAIDAMNANLGGAIGKMGDKGPGMMEKILGALKGLGATILGALGLKSAFSKVTDLFGSKTPPAGGPPPGPKGSLKSRIGKGLWGAAKWAGKGLVTSGWQIGKFAVQRLAWPLVVGAVKVGGAIIATLGWPLVLAGLAIGAVGYVGWQMWKKHKAKQKPLHFLRMIQYGINGRDGDRVEQILQLETLLGNSIKGIDTDSPDLDTKNVDFKKVYQIFGLVKTPKEGEVADPEEEPEEIDEDRAKALIHWIAYRFKPVYLGHIAALNKLAKQKDLNKTDEVIKTKGKMHKFLDLVTLPNMTKAYDNLKAMSPFKDKLTHNAKDVLNWFKECRKVADKYPDDAVEPVAEKEDLTKDDKSDKDKEVDAPSIDPATKSEVEVKADPEVVAATKAHIEEQKTDIRALNKTPVSVAPVVAAVVPVKPPVVADRYSSVDVGGDVKAPAQASNELSRQIELSGMVQLNTSMVTSSNLLSTAVNTLSSMDSTLIAIHGEVRKLNIIQNAKLINPTSNGMSDKDMAKLEMEINKLSGETLKQIEAASKKDDSQNKYRQRSNPSPARKLAIT